MSVFFLSMAFGAYTTFVMNAAVEKSKNPNSAFYLIPMTIACMCAGIIVYIIK